MTWTARRARSRRPTVLNGYHINLRVLGDYEENVTACDQCVSRGTCWFIGFVEGLPWRKRNEFFAHTRIDGCGASASQPPRRP